MPVGPEIPRFEDRYWVLHSLEAQVQAAVTIRVTRHRAVHRQASSIFSLEHQ
jgi:hypothetical protein